MKMREDVVMSIRSLRNHLIETILLLLGIGLGIGATTAGISVLSGIHTMEAAMTNLPEYREIIVRPAANAQEMDVALTALTDDQTVELSGADLAAAQTAPDVAYAYLMNGTHLRILTAEELTRMSTFGGAEDRPATDEGALPAESAPAAEGARDSGAAPEADGGARDSGAAPAAPDDFQARTAEAVDALSQIDNPMPVIDELTGYSVTEAFFDAYGLQAAEGSVFTSDDIDGNRNYLVLGSTLGQSLFEDGAAVGRQILANFTLYTIVGVLEPTETSVDTKAFLPARITGATGVRGFGPPRESTVRFMVADGDVIQRAEQQLSSYFDQEYGAGTVVIENSREEFEYLQDRNGRIVTVILVLSVAGLLIAAVNVSNILYTRAMKQQRNAGILKALGATRRRVFEAFFAEGLTVAVFGALAGTAISLGLAALFTAVLGLGTISVLAFLAGLLGAVALTVTFMFTPAIQVARISAADAIRYE